MSARERQVESEARLMAGVSRDSVYEDVYDLEAQV